MKLQKGDDVKVIRGKDQGKTGKIEKVFTKTQKVLLAGVNEYKRHVKARTQNQKSEIVTITKPLPVTNVMFICPKCKKPARIGYGMEKDKKIRVCRNCGKAL
jgi:large subunit ribosomal protein L24